MRYQEFNYWNVHIVRVLKVKITEILPSMAELSLAQTVSLCWGSSCQPTGEFHGFAYARRLNASWSIFLLLSFFPCCCRRCIDWEYNCLPNSNIFSIACLSPPQSCFLLFLFDVFSILQLPFCCCWIWLTLLVSGNRLIFILENSLNLKINK